MLQGDNLLKIANLCFCAPELHLIFSHSEGNIRLSTQDLKGRSESPYRFGIIKQIKSSPWALFGPNLFFVYFAISALVTRINKNVLAVLY